MSVSERLARYSAQGSAQSRIAPQAAPQGTPQAPGSTIVPTPESEPGGIQGALRARLGGLTEEPGPNPAPWWIEGLPAAGGIAGGILGGSVGAGTTFGLGTAPGAALGAGIGTAGGEAYRQVLAHALGYDAPATSGEAASRIGQEGGQAALISGLTAGGGQVLGAASKAPILRHLIPFSGRIGKIADDVGELGGKIRGAVTSRIGSAASRVAPKAADEASEAGRALAKKRWAQGAKPGKKPDLKVVEKPKPGSAQSRVEGAPQRAKRLKQRQKDNRRHPQTQQQPQIQVGSDLEARLAQAVKVEQHMNKLGFTDAEKMLVRQQLMNQ